MSQQETIERLRVSIASEVLEGKSEDEIIRSLTTRGLSEANARILINDAKGVARSSAESDPQARSVWSRNAARSEGYKKIGAGVLSLVIWLGITFFTVTFSGRIPFVATILLIGALIGLVTGIIQVIQNS
jgi:hypothetical protein